MKLQELSIGDLTRRLKTVGVRFHTGPFVVCLRSSLSSLAATFHELYGDSPLDEGQDIADYHVQVDRPFNARRWIRPQAEFRLDGISRLNPLPVQAAPAVLEWGLNFCVCTQAHQYLLFHSAVVERNGCALMLAAPPGSGKSTLCAALVARGWRLFSDELGIVRHDDGLLIPLPRPLSLKERSIRIIKEFAPDFKFGPECRNTGKGTVAHVKPPSQSVLRANTPAVPAWVVFPQYRPGAQTSLRPVSKSRAFFRLAEQSFNYQLHAVRGFELVAGLIDRSNAYDFSYSDLNEAVDLFDRLEPPVPAAAA